MGEVLFEMEQNLNSKQINVTPQEIKVLMACKSRALREFTFGGLAAATVAWTASSKMNKFFRLNLSAGSAVLFGMWRLTRSLDSCVDHILALDGTQMQAELATMRILPFGMAYIARDHHLFPMVRKYQNDPWRMQRISKKFYSERVFDDSSSEQPKIRWRFRNNFSDNIAHGQRTHDSNSQGDLDNGSYGDHHNFSDGDSKDTKNDSDKKQINFALKQVPMNSGVDAMEDPLDFLFGYPTREEVKVSRPNTSSISPKEHARNRRRSHRRRRMHHQEDLSDIQHV